nr:retrotransposon protein, putative, Ty1-copia subclass [Tanacetum cinerariifolium]
MTLEEELSSVLSQVVEEEKERSFWSWWFTIIELNTILNRSWIYDTGCDTHIYKSSIYAVSKKRAKLDLDSALLWHCCLEHISKKCIEKLQHDGLLNSTDLRAFENCVSCMSGKMERKPYTHQVERAKDLLGLRHTNVCGPFKIMSRQRASYFVTFTDDFSRCGYVYLLKHKHEVFETFKVFQKEVKNQLDADELKSYTGYVFVLNDGAVDWKSAKQSIFTTSSAEAEYIAASKEAVWLGNSFLGLVLFPQLKNP